MNWEHRIPELLKRYDALTARLSDPAIFSDQAALREVGREHAELTPAVEAARKLERVRAQLADARELAEADEGAVDADLRELARAEQVSPGAGVAG